MSNRESIIDRYFHGSLSHSERQELQHLLQTDPEARDLFETEKMLTRTMQAERNHLASVDHSATYARFLSGLATQTTPSTPTIPPRFAVPATPWYGTLLGRASVVTTVVAILVFGAFALRGTRPGALRQSAPQMVASQPQNAPAAHGTGSNGFGSSAAQQNAPQVSDRSVSETSLPPQAQPAQSRISEQSLPNMVPQSVGSSGIRRNGVATAENRVRENALRADRQTHAKTKSDADATVWTLPSADHDQPPVFRSDTLNVNLKSAQP